MINNSIFTQAGIGAIALNFALFFYVINYIPQLFHNRKQTHLRHMSQLFNFMLWASYVLDLVYGVMIGMPWQYILTSTIGTCYLCIQQYQLYKLHGFSNKQFNCSLLAQGMVLFGGSILVTLGDTSLLEASSIFLGAGYLLPQLIKNFREQDCHAIAWQFVLIAFFSVICDLISAWCLHWPFINKLGAVLFFTINLAYLCQYFLAYRIAQKASAEAFSQS